MSETVEQLREKIHNELEAATEGKWMETSQDMHFHYRIKIDLVNAIEDSINSNGTYADEAVCAKLLKLDNVLDAAYVFWETKKNYYPLDEAAAMGVQLLAEDVMKED